MADINIINTGTTAYDIHDKRISGGGSLNLTGSTSIIGGNEYRDNAIIDLGGEYPKIKTSEGFSQYQIVSTWKDYDLGFISFNNKWAIESDVVSSRDVYNFRFKFNVEVHLGAKTFSGMIPAHFGDSIFPHLAGYFYNTSSNAMADSYYYPNNYQDFNVVRPLTFKFYTGKGEPYLTGYGCLPVDITWLSDGLEIRGNFSRYSSSNYFNYSYFYFSDISEFDIRLDTRYIGKWSIFRWL